MTEDKTKNNFQVWIPILLAVNLALRIFVIIRPVDLIDDISIPDDSYLTLTISRNIAMGYGPLYGDTFTNGFQPLHAFLMVPVFWFAGNDYSIPVYSTLILTTIF